MSVVVWLYFPMEWPRCVAARTVVSRRKGLWQAVGGFPSFSLSVLGDVVPMLVGAPSMQSSLFLRMLPSFTLAAIPGPECSWSHGLATRLYFLPDCLSPAHISSMGEWRYLFLSHVHRPLFPLSSGLAARVPPHAVDYRMVGLRPAARRLDLPSPS